MIKVFFKIIFYKIKFLFSRPYNKTGLKSEMSSSSPAFTFSRKQRLTQLSSKLKSKGVTWLEYSELLNLEINKHLRSKDYKEAKKKIEELNNFTYIWITRLKYEDSKK